jgi:glutamyl-tRNA(Gln) amidotransferase subunit E
MGKYKPADGFKLTRIFELFRFIRNQELDPVIAKKMLPLWYQHPKMDFESVLTQLKFKRIDPEEVASKISFLHEKYKTIGRSTDPNHMHNWIMGQLRPTAIGNMDLTQLAKMVKQYN